MLWQGIMSPLFIGAYSTTTMERICYATSKCLGWSIVIPPPSAVQPI